MSGGGDKKKGSAPAAAATPATPAPTQPMMTVAAGLPGQLDTLAGQLAASFGQSPADMMAYLNSVYKPTQVPDMSQGFIPPPAPAPAKTTSQPKQTRTAYTNTRS